MTKSLFLDSISLPLQVGLIGTGYAAKLRAEALKSDPRTHVVAVTGHTLAKTQEFCQTHGGQALGSWVELLQRSPLDLVIICTINQDHGAIVRAALEADKHVIVEYPLAMDVAEAEALITLARAKQRFLHVEHIELLGGVHRALKASLPQIGIPFYARYATTKPEHPAPRRWTYHRELFGFPLIGALSRLHRLTDLFGTVANVRCQSRFWDREPSDPHYTACICTAQLRFHSGLIAEVTYAKGEAFWHAERRFEVTGEQGALLLDGEQGTLINSDGSTPIEVGSRRGLFAQDTAIAIDHLLQGTPLYITPEASLYTLKVAVAARESANTGQTIAIV